MILRRLVAALLGIMLMSTALAAVVTTAAAADAVFVASSPAGRSTVGAPLSRVQIAFNEVVTDAAITVAGPDGKVSPTSSVTTGQVISTDFELLTAEGRYVVTWSVISADGDPVDGAFDFTFQADAAPPLPMAAAAVAEGGVSWFRFVLIAVAALLLVVLMLQARAVTRRLRKLRGV